jgi:hypothetical protein
VKIAELTGFEGRIVWDTSQSNGQPRLRLHVSRAEREFGFRARTPLDEGLRKTVEWYAGTERAAAGNRSGLCLRAAIQVACSGAGSQGAELVPIRAIDIRGRGPIKQARPTSVSLRDS